MYIYRNFLCINEFYYLYDNIYRLTLIMDMTNLHLHILWNLKVNILWYHHYIDNLYCLYINITYLHMTTQYYLDIFLNILFKLYQYISIKIWYNLKYIICLAFPYLNILILLMFRIIIHSYIYHYWYFNHSTKHLICLNRLYNH